MDILSRRITKVVESVLENEALVSGLDKTAAEVLQNWGVKNATRVVEKTHTLDDDSAEKIMYPQLKASRRLLRAIRVWVEHEQKVTAEEREKLWGKVEKRVRGLYGDDISLPSPNQFSGESPMEFIVNLQEWLEGYPKEKKKSFFESLFDK